ncbi:Holliday junction resolvase RecU [Weissella soli]|uniref:Holliday junction resolvase RecU n=1 Tax=Weissella soli TaxID=155866 RepID=UPI0011BBE24B|nr:Holliday junction resolvase RecU [Weissella soli]QEA34878.1 Holliday junction resolvase RecU [Weissella soli]
MAIHYPNGRKFVPDTNDKPVARGNSQSNRGMSLENELNLANQYYLSRGIANIHKKPTPIQIVNVDYPKRAAAKITEAYFRQASTTDYNGIYQGHYIDFDAKETTSLTSFPLSNVHKHQVTHLRDIVNQGGWAFFIIRFSKLSETYVIKASLLIAYWDQQATHRKSIPYVDIATNGQLIEQNIMPTLPYLKAVDRLMLANH